MRHALPRFGASWRGGRSGSRSYGDALRAAPALRWIGYLSTIGVYGDLEGAWADEDTPAEPGYGPRRRAHRARKRHGPRFAASGACPLDIFRLAGIYGPGRSPLDRIRARRCPAHREARPGLQPHPCGRHRANRRRRDVSGAPRSPARASSTSPTTSPRRRRTCILYAAELLGAPPPPEIPFESAGLSPMARSFYAGNKRMRNDKIKRELGVVLKYPTYREGLRALAEEMALAIATKTQGD